MDPNHSTPESQRHSCGTWLTLALNISQVFSLPKMGAVTCGLTVQIQVQQNQAIREKSTNAKRMVPFLSTNHDTPRVRLTAVNRGNTLWRVGATVDITASLEGTYMAIEDMTFVDTWILPGVTVCLEADYLGPHPDQPPDTTGPLAPDRRAALCKKVTPR
jgi:hypothetical protein